VRPGVSLVAQPHGGALKSGGNPGNAGGTGRPPNELRENLRGLLSEDGLPVLKDLIRGTPMREIEVPLTLLLRHARCPCCNGKLEDLNRETSPTVRLLVRASASPRDRLGAIGFTGQYGLGTNDEITMLSPDVKDRIRRLVQLVGKVGSRARSCSTKWARY
jgi:hypothetical protein